MANPEHLAILKQGVKAWNFWRGQNRDEFPNLTGTILRSANLRGANLANVNLYGADLSDIELAKAILEDSELSDANLSHANLSAANLAGANLSGANLVAADLRRASLRYTHLSMANLTFAHLSGADFHRANLTGTYFTRADFGDADLSKARVSGTAFADVDLSRVNGLTDLEHQGPSTIGLDTLYKSHGKIPDKFLRDAGVPEDVIEHLLPLIRSGLPVQWHSCFISYSTKDEEFARRLHSRMREAGLRVWFAPENLKGGDKLHEQLFRAIQLYDKLLLVLSEHSIKSEWVMTEIRKAREVEKKENRRKLFPIRLVDFDTLRAWTCFDADTGKDLAVEVREYFIPDFSNWKDHDAFEKSFARLQEDLKAEGKPKGV